MPRFWGKTALSGICLVKNRIGAIVLVAVMYQLGIRILFDKLLFMQTRGLLPLKAKFLLFLATQDWALGEVLCVLQESLQFTLQLMGVILDQDEGFCVQICNRNRF